MFTETHEQEGTRIKRHKNKDVQMVKNLRGCTDRGVWKGM